MRDMARNLGLFIFLSVVLSGLAGCSNSGGAPSNNAASSNSNRTGAANSDSGGATAKSESKELEPAILQSQLEELDGKNFKLEDKKGKVVLLNLWGIWCGPCIKEMPHLIELQEKYKDRDFEIIGLNVGDENGEKEAAANVKEFSEKMKLNYRLAYAEEDFYKELLKFSKFDGVPQSFLIDREGRLSEFFVGGSSATMARLKSKVETVVNEN